MIKNIKNFMAIFSLLFASSALCMQPTDSTAITPYSDNSLYNTTNAFSFLPQDAIHIICGQLNPIDTRSLAETYIGWYLVADQVKNKNKLDLIVKHISADPCWNNSLSGDWLIRALAHYKNKDIAIVKNLLSNASTKNKQIMQDIFTGFGYPSFFADQTEISDDCLVTVKDVFSGLEHKNGCKSNFNIVQFTADRLYCERLSHSLLMHVVTLLGQNEEYDWNIKTDTGLTLLMISSYRGDADVVEMLLAKKDIDVNAQDNYGDTALIHASYGGCAAVIEMLLAKEGINVNAQYNNAMGNAIEKDNRSIVEMLLMQEGVDLYAEYGQYGTVLRWACSSGCQAIVEMLLAREGFDPSDCISFLIQNPNVYWREDIKNLIISKMTKDEFRDYLTTKYSKTVKIGVACSLLALSIGLWKYQD